MNSAIVEKLEWRVNTPGLITEVFANPGTGMLEKPFKIFSHILGQVADRAAELHDPELDKLMMQLALYEVANPRSDEYDPDLVTEYMEKY